MVLLADPIAEDAVVATFLVGELDGRFRSSLLEICITHGLAEAAIRDRQDIEAKTAAARRRVLADHRGWPDQGLCEGLPSGIAWYRASLDLGDLRERVFYIRYYWEEFSEGTRMPAAVAHRLSTTVAPAAWGIYAEILDALRAGAHPPEPILVSEPSLERLVILEGHARITAYLLDPRLAPMPLQAIVGISPRISEWDQW